jgi:hypothetical protein
VAILEHVEDTLWKQRVRNCVLIISGHAYLVTAGTHSTGCASVPKYDKHVTYRNVFLGRTYHTGKLNGFLLTPKSIIELLEILG